MPPALLDATRSAIATILFCLLVGQAQAGATVQPDTCGEACRAAVRSFAGDYLSKAAPMLAAPAERFEMTPGGSRSCPARPGRGAAVYAVMIGPNAIEGLTRLNGPANDIDLMRQVMRERGIADEFVTVVQGAEASRAGMIGAMARPLPCLREGDQVVLVYTGWGTVFPHEWLDFTSFYKALCDTPSDPERRDLCAAAAAAAVGSDFISSLSDAIDWAVKDWLLAVQPTSYYLPGQRQHVLIGGDSAIGEAGVERLAGVSALELSNFVTQVRNRGADAFLIVDTRLAASGDLYALQVQASASPVWAADGDQMVKYDGFPPIQDQYNEAGPVPLFGSGQYAALYASDVDSEAFEYSQGEGAEARPLGALIFRVAEVLRRDGKIRFKDMALAIARSFDARNRKIGDSGRQEPLFQTSSLDLTLLAPRAVTPKRGEQDIEIITPTPKRGPVSVEETMLTVVARYTGTGRAKMAIVDGDLTPIDGNGQFRGEVADAATKFSVALRVLGDDYATLAATELRLRDRPADPAIAAPARRVALLIANDSYDDPAFPALRTPLADATAVADILRRRFGFRTAIDGGAAPLDLFLRNATKAQVQQVLFELRRRLTAEDQLLIYYAGHGENDPDLGAYWVPVDGQRDADFSWIDANEITRELKRMNAASILVISDSCYAGGLSRGGDGGGPTEARERYLAKASRLKARQLIASGGEEPVEDGGGGGHSIFAKALIDALEAMPEQVFTAAELFELKIKPAVIASGSALTEGQIPGFHRISRAGDEPSSEFIFQNELP